MNGNRQVIVDHCFVVKLIKLLIFLNTESNAFPLKLRHL